MERARDGIVGGRDRDRSAAAEVRLSGERAIPILPHEVGHARFHRGRAVLVVRLPSPVAAELAFDAEHQLVHLPYRWPSRGSATSTTFERGRTVRCPEPWRARRNRTVVRVGLARIEQRAELGGLEVGLR